MFDGLQEFSWSHTSNVLATLWNTRPFLKSRRLIEPHQVNPLKRGRPKPTQTVPITALRDVFVRSKQRRQIPRHDKERRGA